MGARLGRVLTATERSKLKDFWKQLPKEKKFAHMALSCQQVLRGSVVLLCCCSSLAECSSLVTIALAPSAVIISRPPPLPRFLLF